MSENYNSNINTNDLEDMRREFEKEKNKEKKNKSRRIPDDLLISPSPLINQLADYISFSTKRYIPQYSLQTAITFMGHLYSRSFECGIDSTSSIYSILIGESGVGKGYGAKAIARLDTFHANFASGFTSEAGLRGAFIKNPCVLSIMDEVGGKFGSKDGNDVKLLIALREVYSCYEFLAIGYSPMENGRAKLNTDNYTIKRPCLSILGMTTPMQLSDGLTEYDIENGTVNRFVLVDALDSEVIRNTLGVERDPSTDLINKLFNHSSLTDQLGKESYKSHPNIIFINYEDGVEDYIDDEFDRLRLGKNKKYTVRVIENAIRLSLIVTLSMSLKKIPMDIIKWSIKYNEYWSYNIKKLAIESNSSDYAKDKSRVMSVLNDNYAGVKLGKMNKTALRNLKKFQRTEVYQDLIDDKLITIKLVSGDKGRPFELIELV